MNTKKVFGAALSILFVFGALAGLGLAKFNDTTTTKEARVQTRGFSVKEESAGYNADDFHAVNIGRDELIVDIASLNSTTKSKSATITFKSTRLVGWGPSNQNVYVVIDDPDYSGSEDRPSISGKDYPIFNGYTIELANKSTMSYNVKDPETGKNVKKYNLIIPNKMTYGNTFEINNKTILKDAFVYSAKTPAIDYIIIPNGVKNIESKAFQNIPSSIVIRCQAASRPEGWAEDWLFNSPDVQVEWGYEVSAAESDYLAQATGINTKNYGRLVNAATSRGALYTIVDDVNFTGDYDNPVRTDYGLSKPYKLTGYVHSASINSLAETVTIPETLVYSEDFHIKNTTIAAKAFAFEKQTEEKPYTGTLKNIKIPAGIEVIESGAFKNVPESVQIYCEVSEANKPIRWASDWCDAKASQIHWGTSMTALEKTAGVDNTDVKIRLGNGATPYMIGYRYLTHVAQYYCPYDRSYYSESDLVDGKIRGHDVLRLEDVTPLENRPLVIYYEIRDDIKNQVLPMWQEMKLSSEEDTSNKSNYYDTVRDSTESRSFDVILDEGQTFVEDSVKIYNIYRQKTVYLMADTIVHEEGEEARVEKKLKSFLVPDTSVCFVASASKRYDREININEIITYSYKGMSRFGDYSMIEMNIDKVLPSFWNEAISPDVKASHQDSLDSGAYSIRYCIYGLNTSFYRITYVSTETNREKTVTIPVNTPKSTLELSKDKGNAVSFLVKNSDVGKDFKLENIVEFEIIGLTLNIHLWDNAKSIKIGLTDVSEHFGAVDILPRAEAKQGIFDVILFIVLFLIILTVLFAGGAVALYFYLKERFKNDEFRRMKPKKYIKSAILSYLGTLIITTTVLFIVFRGGLFNNSISVHNPLDAFIVVPGIISIVVIGYFIKYLVTLIKENKKRKEAKKLKLEQDTVDDGTK